MKEIGRKHWPSYFIKNFRWIRWTKTCRSMRTEYDDQVYSLRRANGWNMNFAKTFRWIRWTKACRLSSFVFRSTTIKRAIRTIWCYFSFGEFWRDLQNWCCLCCKKSSIKANVSYIGVDVKHELSSLKEMYEDGIGLCGRKYRLVWMSLFVFCMIRIDFVFRCTPLCSSKTQNPFIQSK